MAENNCTHNCSTCSSNCAERKAPQFEQPHAESNIKHTIAVVSGKGGVGKSLVTSMLAVALSRAGYRVGILDADITGPSIPKAFGLSAVGGFDGDESGLFPPKTAGGIDVMSLNLLLPDEKSPVIWRGPVIAGTVKQFYTDFIWDDVDFLLIDCPPGTGDVPLTVFQSIKLDGVVIVSSPQELVAMIVAKALSVPMKQIADNAGVDGAVIISKIRESGKLGFGYDAYSETYCDMMSAGIVDPCKVTRSALQNAASIASTVLTSEAVVYERKEDKAQPQAPSGMDGMY